MEDLVAHLSNRGLFRGWKETLFLGAYVAVERGSTNSQRTAQQKFLSPFTGRAMAKAQVYEEVSIPPSSLKPFRLTVALCFSRSWSRNVALC